MPTEAWIAAGLAALATLVVVIVYLNLAGGVKRLERQLPRLYDADDREFRRCLGALLGPAFVDGNRVRRLVNGDQIFPAMLEAIAAAERTICLETFIYWSGRIGRAFVDALGERARHGVRVHVLLDWAGSLKMDDALLAELKAAGCEIERFHQPHWSNLVRMNNRTHRKLLVVDGSIGFTGGVGIADPWLGNARNPEEWRDTHYRVEGPVVAQMQSVFLDNWMRATGTVLHGEAYFPALQPRGGSAAQMFSSSPEGGSESMQLMYLLAVTAARRSIALSAAYFVPDGLTIRTLTDAARRGVRVRVIVPSEHIDEGAVRHASRATWGPMLEAGIEIREYLPTMYHVKGLIVDDGFASVGSTNFDNRSFRLNDEANLNVLDAEFAAGQWAVFEADWAQSRPVTLEQWRRRPWNERVWEAAATLLRTQL